MRRLDLPEHLPLQCVPAWRPGPSSLTCIVPAFNEAAGLARFLRDLHEAVTPLVPRLEIILVDDGSEDETPCVAASLTRSLGLHYVRLSRNFGKEAALT